MQIKKLSAPGVIVASYLPLLLSGLLTVFVVTYIYSQNQSILKNRLRERLIAIVSTASLQFSSDDLAQIKGEADLNSPQLKKVVNIMNKIRSVNKNLRYIYVWRKTNDPKYLEFVVDAEMLDPIDTNGDGQISGDELPPIPGEKYDITQIPESKKLFEHPFAQQDFIIDKWGTFLSGFAPIRDKSGNAIAVLGVDVEVSDFSQIIRATFTPFFILTVILLFLLTIQTFVLVRIWTSRVDTIRDLDRQKDELLGLVSHQLAKPITAIKWNLESMLDGDTGPLTADQKESAVTMRSMATTLSDLVSMILDVSRIQLGKITIDPQPLDLNTLFKQIFEIVQPTVEEKKIHFVTSITPAVLPTLLLDRRYTRMTFENIMTNAVKYTPNGGTVTFTMRLQDGILHCSISDTGCGIPKQEQQKIFGKMYRASNVRNTAEGNGFGLYVARGATESQGGKIWFESTEGKGTTFFVQLPATPAA